MAKSSERLVSEPMAAMPLMDSVNPSLVYASAVGRSSKSSMASDGSPSAGRRSRFHRVEPNHSARSVSPGALHSLPTRRDTLSSARSSCCKSSQRLCQHCTYNGRFHLQRTTCLQRHHHLHAPQAVLLQDVREGLDASIHIEMTSQQEPKSLQLPGSGHLLTL